MAGLKRCYLVAAMVISAETNFPIPAYAQPGLADPESLIAASQKVDPGVQLARRQIAEKDLLGALATLERVLLAHPQAVLPRLLYASTLCRLDDRDGAEVELSAMKGKGITDQSWAEVTAACGSVPRPGARGRKETKR